VRAVPMRSGTGELTGWLGTSTEVEDPKRAGNAAFEEQRFKGYGRLVGGVAHDFNNLLVCILGGASCAMQSIPASHPAQEMLHGVVHAGERLAELTRRMLAYAGKATFYVEPTDLGQLIREGLRQHSKLHSTSYSVGDPERD
jgi:signal transduction histidine kinase